MESWHVVLLLAWAWVGNQSKGTNLNDTRARRVLGNRATSCPCGSSNKGRVLGGIQALPNEYPWVASLVRNKGLIPVCGASIITQWVAITAAHCIANKEPSSLFAGTSDLSKSGILIPLKSYSIYNWNPGMTGGRNDISLLFLAHSITFSAIISPICLPTKKLNLNKKWVKLIGWGKLGYQKPGSKNLMEADVQVLPFNECKKYHGLQLPETQVCVRTPGKGGCFGDSGGPVVWLDPETNKYTLVGLVSFGSPRCDTKIPTVNTDVSAFISWIKNTIHTAGCHKV
ncbi:chymotrypsinogen A isoform X1 [Halyomorpha halys]|uniref:chymotrypsinogen A isoform X1 n=1 Tax=Halyomorpha halys TaxID=286706 RepID=UPI0006D4FEE9